MLFVRYNREVPLIVNDHIDYTMRYIRYPSLGLMMQRVYNGIYGKQKENICIHR